MYSRDSQLVYFATTNKSSKRPEVPSIISQYQAIKLDLMSGEGYVQLSFYLTTNLQDRLDHIPSTAQFSPTNPNDFTGLTDNSLITHTDTLTPLHNNLIP